MSTNQEASALLSSSKKRKEDGNRLFGNKIYSAALACYRAGLEDLPPYDKVTTNDQGDGNTTNDGTNDYRNEIINLEVGLRSNIALALLKLAEEKQLPPLPGGVATNNQEEVHKLYTEIEEECNIALQLDSMNPKLYHRRGLARQYFAEQNQMQLQCDGDSSSSSNDDETQLRLDEQWKLAEEDFKKSIDILNSQTGVKKTQVDDACKVLENLRLTKEKSQVVMKTEGHASFKQQQMIQSNGGHMEQIPFGSDGDFPPSPQVQRDYILQLLSRCTTNPPIINGEAYFLISMEWWQSWCQYVSLFSMYTTTAEGGNSCNNNRNGGRSPMKTKQHCRQIDTANQQILQLLPPGATLPPYLEQDRNEALYPKKDEKKKKKKKSCDSSSSSDDSDDDDGYTAMKKSPPRPGDIDNSSLILPNNNEGWCCTIESAQNDQQKSNNENQECDNDAVLLRNHLVRGYDYELLPREAYGALRAWYGESSPHILRRVVTNADAAVGASSTQRVELYSEHWDIITRRSSSLSSSSSSSKNSNNTSFKCSACGSPTGKSSCTRCGVARYCNRQCQMNHWTYHKKMCSKLKKQKEEGSLGANNSSSTNLFLDSAWGRVGLNNLGNTCFLNSAMQCMMHVAPLTRYFLSDRYSADINTHNILGTGGKVAKAYAAVLKELWMGSHQYQNVSPTALKRAIELFAPQFSGASQQDSAELITYLLDALHEDLNRVKNPPYVEMPDVDLGRKLSISGAEAWQLSCIRNDSFVYDNFYGLYKSKCVCPQCNKVTVKFDPFNHITLEIPQQPLRHMALLLTRDCAETGPGLPTKYCVSLPSTANVNNMKERLSEVSGVPQARLVLCEFDVNGHRLKSIYNDPRPISTISQDSIIGAYESAPTEDRNQVHCAVIHVSVNSNLVDVGGINRQPFGIPIFLSFNASFSCAQIYEKILMYVISFVKTDSSGSVSKEDLRSNLRLRAELDGRPVLIPSDANETLQAVLGDGCVDNVILFELEWVDIVDSSETQIQRSDFTSVDCHPSYLEQEKKLSSSDPSSVSLYECFDSFTQPERLDDENMLYCSGCKKHVQAMKTVTLWRIPKILVVHLKRFEYRGTFNRSKIGVLVDFPLDGLDLDSHAPQSSVAQDDFVDDRVPMMYDLFGVVNHYGRMGYGHYTAHARRWDETGAEQKWAEFDDENVTDVANTDSIVSPAAYVLFYKRRLFL